MKYTFFAMGALVGMMTSCDSVEIREISTMPYRDGKEAAISFTYDDGMLCHYTDIAPELEKRGFKATFWIIGDNMGKDEPTYPWMNWEQVADLSRRGHEISNHSWHHPNLTELSEDSLRWEIQYNDSVIESVTGIRPKTFCYPYNAMTDLVVRICSEGRVGTRTFQADHGQIESHQTADSLTQWLNDLLAHRAWGVTMTHGTTYGWDYWTEPEILYRFYDEVKAAEDRVWVGTFAEVSAYIEEQQHLSYMYLKSHRQLVITPHLQDLDPELYCEPVTFCILGTFGNRTVTAQQSGSDLTTTLSGDTLLVNAKPTDEIVIKW